jgi:hypothetical protein
MEAQAFLGRLDSDPTIGEASEISLDRLLVQDASVPRGSDCARTASAKRPLPVFAQNVMCLCTGRHVDATSYYELEAEEYARKGVNLTPDLWLVKLMVGAIDPT